MDAKKVLEIILKDADFVFRFRKNQILVYYSGQRIFNIRLNSNKEITKIQLPASFNVSNKVITELKTEKKYEDVLERYKTVLEYKDKFELDNMGKKLQIKFSIDKFYNYINKKEGRDKFKEVKTALERLNIIENLSELNLVENVTENNMGNIKFHQGSDKYFYINLKIKTELEWDIEKIIDFQYKVLPLTSSIPGKNDRLPFRKLGLPSFSVKMKDVSDLTEEVLRKLIEEFKKLIDIYNVEDGGQNEKIFQYCLMLQDSDGFKKLRAIDATMDIVPYEMEFFIDGKEKKNEGRVDNVYIDKKSGEVILIEIKFNETALSESNGIAKHLKDMCSTVSKGKLTDIIEELSKSLEIRKEIEKFVGIKQYYDGEINKEQSNIKYWVLLGYELKKWESIVKKISEGEKSRIEEQEKNIDKLGKIDYAFFTTKVEGFENKNAIKNVKVSEFEKEDVKKLKNKW